MEAIDVLDVLAVLADVEVRSWIDGGWGVDALLGAQYRDHAVLELVVPADDLERAVAELGSVGFSVEIDGLPTRIQLRDRSGRSVDLHPVRFDESGTGWQAAALPGGGDADYPPEELTYGWVGGERVGCIGPELQVRRRTGRPLTDVDRHDLSLLYDRFSVALPETY